MGARIRQGFAAYCGLLLAASLLGPAGAYGVELSDRLSLNGFYSLDASVSYGGDTALPSRSESIQLKNRRPSLDYSVVGVQADFSLTDSLRFTAQAVSSKQVNDDLSPSLQWAYLTYDAGDDLSLRAGKLKMPLLQGTELRYVGFSRLWVRPLVPTSGASGFDDYHGAEFIKRQQLGQYNLKIQGAYGVANHEKSVVDDRDIKLLSARLERNESWLSLALMHARHDFYARDLSRVVAKNADVFMASLEGEVQHDKAILNYGAARSQTDVIPSERLAYLSVGYRLNSVTPYLLYQYRSMHFTLPPAPPPPGPPPGPPGPPPPPPLDAPKDGELTTRGLSLGLRHDLDGTHAIKAQIERQFSHDASYRSRPADDRATTVFSISFEGVF